MRREVDTRNQMMKVTRSPPITVDNVVSHTGRMMKCGSDAMGNVMAGSTFSVWVLKRKAYQRNTTVTAVQANCNLLHLAPTASKL